MTLAKRFFFCDIYFFKNIYTLVHYWKSFLWDDSDWLWKIVEPFRGLEIFSLFVALVHAQLEICFNLKLSFSHENELNKEFYCPELCWRRSWRGGRRFRWRRLQRRWWTCWCSRLRDKLEEIRPWRQLRLRSNPFSEKSKRQQWKWINFGF